MYVCKYFVKVQFLFMFKLAQKCISLFKMSIFLYIIYFIMPLPFIILYISLQRMYKKKYMWKKDFFHTSTDNSHDVLVMIVTPGSL